MLDFVERATEKTSMRKLTRVRYAIVVSLLCFAAPGGASTIAVSGVITQSTADTGVPAMNNPALNNIADGDTYIANLSVTGSVTGPGAYNLAGLAFADTAAGASETGFISGSMTIAQTGTTDQFSVFGCLTNCATGNQLALEFSLPAAALGASGFTAPIPALLPMDLLEDDGNTDIQGTVSTYNYQGPGTDNGPGTGTGPGPGTGTGPATDAPEPASFVLAGLSLITIGAARRRHARR